MYYTPLSNTFDLPLWQNNCNNNIEMNTAIRFPMTKDLKQPHILQNSIKIRIYNMQWSNQMMGSMLGLQYESFNLVCWYKAHVPRDGKWHNAMQLKCENARFSLLEMLWIRHLL